MNCCEQRLCGSGPLLAYQRPDKRRLLSSGGGFRKQQLFFFYLSKSTRTLSGLSAHDERLLKQSGAHCSLPPPHTHLSVKIEKKRVLFWDDRVTDRLTRGWKTVETPPCLRCPPLSSANERLSQPRAARSQHAPSVTCHLPDSGAAIRQLNSWAVNHQRTAV